MKYLPYDYQKYCTDYLKEHKLSALLIDFGLGKTVITLTALFDLLFDSFEISRVLVIAPLRVCNVSWPDEIKKWDHLKGLTFSLCTGSVDERLFALNNKADITIINRENVEWLVEESGYEFDFDVIVVDELSSFKNNRSKRFKALMKVRPLANRVIGLTGTPAPNGLMDLWAEFKVIDMGKRLGKFITSYRERWFKPEKSNGHIVFNYVPLPCAKEEIYSAISDISVSMRAKDKLKMPELIVSDCIAYLKEDERKKYDTLRKHLVLSIDGRKITSANAAVLTGKLSQLANGCVYSDDGKSLDLHNAKLEVLSDIIEQSDAENILVAYWFKHDLERIKNTLSKMDVIYDDINSDESISKWNDGKIKVGLIHPSCVGYGLNLQKGWHHLVWFGLTWSLELYEQTIGRLYRQGQSSDTVIVHRIITQNTIDERIIKALEQKNLTQASLLEAVKVEMEGVI